MNETIVFTLTGTDKVGIVEEVTSTLLRIGGNIEASRMARLGGEFAVLLLLSLPSGSEAALRTAVNDLASRGYKVTTTRTDGDGRMPPDGQAFRLEVRGADHEGIVHSIASSLAERHINIESMDTDNSRAPNSGALLFSMTALVLAPPTLDEQEWREQLERVSREQNVDVIVSPVR